VIENPKILIIDDDDIGSKPLVMRLQKRSMSVQFTTTGANVLELLKAEKFNIVFLDMMMPDFSGHQILSIIRLTYSQLELPVIMLSGKDDVPDIVESLKLGANDYMVKPANIDIAMARIQTQLMLSEYYNLSIKKSELAAIHSMVVTYSHEINNPLTIAIGYLNKVKSNPHDILPLERVELALSRISEIISKIKKISEGNETIVFESYAQGSGGKMLQLKK
jgi:DNA-binding response OmpR family regulator